MKKNYKNKMVKSEKVETKKVKRRFICLSECNVPEVGTWKSGDIIDDEKIISKIYCSPFFEEIKGGK